MPRLSYREVAGAGIIAALYATLSLVFYPISFGIYQVRIAEALTVLPFVTRAAVPGLFIGCLLANIFGGMGWADIVFGSALTGVAAIFTRTLARMPARRIGITLAPLPPVIFNSFGVAAYLAPLMGTGYWFGVQMIGLGEVIACYGLGLPLLLLLNKRRRNLFDPLSSRDQSRYD